MNRKLRNILALVVIVVAIIIFIVAINNAVSSFQAVIPGTTAKDVLIVVGVLAALACLN